MSSHVDNRPQPFRTGFTRTLVRLLVKPFFSPWMPVGLMRRGLWLATRTALPARGSRFSATSMNGVRAEKVTCRETGDRVVLYFHGGAYCVGSPATHRAITSRLARDNAATVFVADYRLAPEAPFPAAVDDALECYRYLLEQGRQPEEITLSGDSAGGGLALACLLAAWEEHLPMPATLILFSPWVDLTLANAGEHSPRDAMLSWAGLEKAADLYAANEREHALASPLRADFHGFPPVLIQTGSEEILLAESQQLCERLRGCGVEARLNVFDGMWHVFQAHAGILRVADMALDDVATFIGHGGHP